MMPFRFRKILSLGKGMRINLSKGGISTSLGKRGATLNFGKGGVKSTLGIPGSGLSFSQNLGDTKRKNDATTNILTWVILGIVGLCILIVCCLGLVFLNPDTVTATATPTAVIVDVSTIIAQTANAAVIQTRAASSPTSNVTATSLPTLTLAAIIPATEIIEPTATVIFILPTQAPSSGGGAVCSCSGDSLNCGDFSSQSSAQACMNYCVQQGAGDIHNLDGDANGLACESLP